jgi:hypothetical protein
MRWEEGNLEIFSPLSLARSATAIHQDGSPQATSLFHDVVCVEDEFVPTTSETDIQYYVANGKGQIEVEKIVKDDVFIMPMKMNGKIVNDGDLILSIRQQ